MLGLCTRVNRESMTFQKFEKQWAMSSLAEDSQES